MDKKSEFLKRKIPWFYRKLMTIRNFEEKVDEFFRQGKVFGAVHTSVGRKP